MSLPIRTTIAVIAVIVGLVLLALLIHFPATAWVALALLILIGLNRLQHVVSWGGSPVFVIANILVFVIALIALFFLAGWIGALGFVILAVVFFVLMTDWHDTYGRTRAI
jgi:hypothetical protein